MQNKNTIRLPKPHPEYFNKFGVLKKGVIEFELPKIWGFQDAGLTKLQIDKLAELVYYGISSENKNKELKKELDKLKQEKMMLESKLKLIEKRHKTELKKQTKDYNEVFEELETEMKLLKYGAE
jgi:hypothetical protein